MSDRLNLLFIMPDQLRAYFLSCYGADFIETPHIDGLAARGVRYERAYSPSPICVPARAMLLTGRNAIQTGVLTNEHYLRPDLDDCGIRTWPEQLGEVGYATAAIGKMEAPFGLMDTVSPFTASTVWHAFGGLAWGALAGTATRRSTPSFAIHARRPAKSGAPASEASAATPLPISRPRPVWI